MQVLYFAWVREIIGKGEEAIELPANVSTVSALLDWLEARSETHARALADRSRLRVAVDQCFAQSGTLVSNTSEVAIFPPVTGG